MKLFFNKKMFFGVTTALVATAAFHVFADFGGRGHGGHDDHGGFHDNRGGHDDNRGGFHDDHHDDHHDDRRGPPVIIPGRGHDFGRDDHRGPRIIIDGGRRRWHRDERVVIRHPRQRIVVVGPSPLETLYRLQMARGEITLLGATTLEQNQTDYDLIPVSQCGLREVQLRVRGNEANIDHLTVFFSDGDSQDIDVNQGFVNGSNSAWIDLSGFRQCVSSVAVIGETVTSWYPYNFNEATVDLFGRR